MLPSCKRKCYFCLSEICCVCCVKFTCNCGGIQSTKSVCEKCVSTINFVPCLICKKIVHDLCLMKCPSCNQLNCAGDLPLGCSCVCIKCKITFCVNCVSICCHCINFFCSTCERQGCPISPNGLCETNDQRIRREIIEKMNV